LKTGYDKKFVSLTQTDSVTSLSLIGLTQTERIYLAWGRCGAGFDRTTSTQCV